MAIRARSLLRKWFGRGLYPTAEQFSDFFDSFLHQTEDKIALDKVDELPDRLNGKYGQDDGVRLEGQVEQLSDTLSGHIIISDGHFTRLDEGLAAETARAEGEEAAIREELAAGDAATLQAGKNYTDGKVADEATLREQGDAATLQAANEHVDSLMASEQVARESGDRSTLQSAKEYVDKAIAELVDGSPAALDTLKELSDALGNDPNFAATVAEQIGQKVDKVTGKGLSTEDYTTAEKSKLAGIASGANNYVHPAAHPASMITEDTSHRFITDAEREAWNSKATGVVATQSVNGLMSAADKKKLDGVAAGANNYVHPSAHPASMITQDATHRFVTDTEKSTWNGKASTTVATSSANGLMSAADKKKLDGLQKALTIQLNETSQPAYDGSVARTINITPESIGAQTAEGYPQYGLQSLAISWNVGRTATLFIPGYGTKALPSGGLSMNIGINIGYPVFILELSSNISTAVGNLVIECSHSTAPNSGTRVFDYHQNINYCGAVVFTKKTSGVALHIVGFMFYPTPGNAYVISVE